MMQSRNTNIIETDFYNYVSVLSLATFTSLVNICYGTTQLNLTLVFDYSQVFADVIWVAGQWLCVVYE